ncbi:MAG: hypothetical protein UHW99_02815 [Methanobrevibacter sp.]|nr:hypothetical protein [Methanobrevibacter sp.]
MSSRSATVLVIFIVAIVAFCLASVFGAMTGQISILPNNSEDGNILDNLSSFVEQGNTGESYGDTSYHDYDYSSQSSGDSHSVETTSDNSGHSSDSSSSSSGSDSSSSQSSSSSSSSSVETTTDSSSSSQSSSSSSGSGPNTS